MANDRGFQSIRRPERDEENLLEALAARKGVARLETPLAAAPVSDHTASIPVPDPAAAAPKPPARIRKDDQPTPRSRMKAMNLELPDYVMRQLKEQALREDCSVRHLIMRSLTAQGVNIRPPDLVADGRRNRGKPAGSGLGG
jgi:hypothetical protein